jgi:hypothetical protein
LSLGRRIYYLFFAEFRWIGTFVLLATIRNCPAFRTPAWAVCGAASVLTLLLVSVLGGAELERYLLPILPIFYTAVAVGLTCLSQKIAAPAIVVLSIGLLINLFWNPPYPFPYENNYAMVDFVRLEQLAAQVAERELSGRTIATAWPYTSALKNIDYGFVTRPLHVLETNDFHSASIRAVPPEKFAALITYTRTWAPENGALSFALVRRFLHHFYDWDADITSDECVALGLHPAISWTLRGQSITIYTRGKHWPSSGKLARR